MEARRNDAEKGRNGDTERRAEGKAQLGTFMISDCGLRIAEFRSKESGVRIQNIEIKI